MLYVAGGADNFRTVQSNGAGRPSSAYGTTVTPAVGSKGSWVELLASTTEDVYAVVININSNATSGASRETIVDIGIGAASSEIVILGDLLCGNADVFPSGEWYYFPIYIPSGTRIAARAQSTVATAFSVYIQTQQMASIPSSVKVGSYVESIGAPGGVAVTIGGASEGAWTLIGTTAKDLWWWQISVQVASSDIAHQSTTQFWDMAVGDGTDFQVIMQDVIASTASSESGGSPLVARGCEFFVPAGSDIYVRGQSSGGADSIVAIAYGLGG